MSDDLLKILADKADLTLEYMRQFRAELAEVKQDVRDLKGGVNSLRTEVNALRGDLLRQERTIAAVEVDVDRINTRLGLSETPQ